MFIIAIFLPPVAVLLCGRPFAAILNLILCLLFYFPGMIHALMVVSDSRSQKRQRQLIRSMRHQHA